MLCSDCSHTILGPLGQLGHQTKEDDCVMYALTVYTPFWDLWDGWVTKQKRMIVLCSDRLHTILGPLGRLGHQAKEHDCVMYALTVYTPFWDLWDS